MRLAAITVIAWIAVVCVGSALILLLIVLAPWRRVRAESRLDKEVETRLLLGEDPGQLAHELDREAAQRSPVAELRRDDAT